MTEDPAKQAWQASVAIAGAPPLEEVREGADKFYRTIRRRNLIEYVACVIVVVAFTIYVFWLPHVLQKVGSALVVVATFYAGWQLHRRASAEPPEKAGTMPLLLFSRAQMVRQRDALRSVFWWYLLPFLPGLMLLMSAGGARARGAEAGTLTGGGVIAMIVTLAMFGFLWWINQVAARKLQRHIDEVDALTGEGG